MPCKCDNFITPWLKAFIFFTEWMTLMKVKFNIQCPWPNFKVTGTNMACKCDNLIRAWLTAFILLPHVYDILIWRSTLTFSDLDLISKSTEHGNARKRDNFISDPIWKNESEVAFWSIQVIIRSWISTKSPLKCSKRRQRWRKFLLYFFSILIQFLVWECQRDNQYIWTNGQ